MLWGRASPGTKGGPPGVLGGAVSIPAQGFGTPGQKYRLKVTSPREEGRRLKEEEQRS